MPIYTDLILTWPQCLQAFQQARLYPGRWFNYNVYRISNTQPLVIYSYSPINLLEENRRYHYYKIFEGSGPIHCNTKIWNSNSIPVYLPEYIRAGDIIIVGANGDELAEMAAELR